MSTDQLLTDIISTKIKDEGPLSFYDYMEMCLYYPELGYYTSGVGRIGSEGDYFTSPSLTPLFGEMIALQIVEMMDCLQVSPFVIVEYGGGNGILCQQILQKIAALEKKLPAVEYYIIEKQKHVLQCASDGEKHVHYIENIEEVDGFAGVVISNELIDNFPVHRFVQRNGLQEIFVGFDNNGFNEQIHPVTPGVIEQLESCKIKLPETAGFEWSSDIQTWIKNISSAMKKGFILTIDYGDQQNYLMNSYLNGGTISCYFKQQRHNDPYINIGSQDITADVNFTQLHQVAEQHELYLTGFTSQAKFLLSMGMCQSIKACENSSPHGNQMELLKTFLLDMGRRFKVMIQHKGIGKPLLRGMQFSDNI